MFEAPSAQFLRRTLMAGGATLAILTGIVASPAVLAWRAEAQEIQPTPVAPPAGSPGSFADLIDHVRPAVVSIQVRQRPSAAGGPQVEGLPPGFEEFFRGQPGRPGPAPMALGSGFFIDQSGIIVTNYHVVEGAEEITVRVSDGREIKADVVGSDELTDLAVLRVRGGGRFPFVTFDDASHVRVGDWVVAVGNPFGLDGTATAGIVSAMGRRDTGGTNYVDYMQIDAPINRGNSGGPTFDLQGRVIGVNSAIFSPTGGNVGIGFAIPSDTASGVVRQLLANGRVSRGWLGVTIQPLDDDIARSLGLPDDKGALVSAVTPDSPAARSGIQQGDVILTFEGHAIEDSRDLTRRVGAAPINRPARVELLRAGARRTLQVRLGERPPSDQLAANTPTPQATPPRATPAPGVENSLGVSVRPLTQEDRTRYNLTANDGGLVITDIEATSGLIEKGVRPGFVILQAGGRAVRTAAELDAATAAARRGGRPLLLQVLSPTGQRAFIATEVGAG